MEDFSLCEGLLVEDCLWWTSRGGPLTLCWTARGGLLWEYFFCYLKDVAEDRLVRCLNEGGL